jgi:hypothetical protein
MGSKKEYDNFPVRETIIVSGNIFHENTVSAKSDFRRDVTRLLRNAGYTVRFVPERKPDP